MTAPNGHGALIPFEPPGAPEPLALAPATWAGGAMAGWTHTRRLEQVERYEPITPAGIPEATPQRPGAATPQLATAVANMWELVKGAALLIALVLAAIALWFVARGVLWLA